MTQIDLTNHDEMRELLNSHKYRTIVDARYSSWSGDDMSRYFHPRRICYVSADGPGHPEFWNFGDPDLPQSHHDFFHMFVLAGIAKAEMRGEFLYLDISRLDWPVHI